MENKQTEAKASFDRLEKFSPAIDSNYRGECQLFRYFTKKEARANFHFTKTKFNHILCLEHIKKPFSSRHFVQQTQNYINHLFSKINTETPEYTSRISI